MTAALRRGEYLDGTVFEFCELRKPDSATVDYDTLCSVPTRTVHFGHVSLETRLRVWTLYQLSGGCHDIGVYAGLCCQVDDLGTVTEILAEVHVFWDGGQEAAVEQA